VLKDETIDHPWCLAVRVDAGSIAKIEQMNDRGPGANLVVRGVHKLFPFIAVSPNLVAVTVFIRFVPLPAGGYHGNPILPGGIIWCETSLPLAA